MTVVLINLIHLPATVLKIGLGLIKQKRYIKKVLYKEIESILKINDGSIDTEDLKKITSYYGLGVPAILGNALSILRNSNLSKAERTASTYLGALTGLGDDFFDKKELSDNDLRYLLNALIHNPDAEVKTLSERIFLGFFKTVLLNTENHKALKNYVQQVFQAQKLSLKQTLPNTSPSEIEYITLHKGGVSLLFYRSVLHNNIPDDERDMLYAMGGLWQLSNDIFDIYKDVQSGVRTLPTITNDIKSLRHTFVNLMDEAFAKAWKTQYNKKNIRQFLRFVSLGISRTFVCLEQLEKLQIQNNNVFCPQNNTRKELICDMEKPVNILKSIRYYLKYDIEKKLKN